MVPQTTGFHSAQLLACFTGHLQKSELFIFSVELLSKNIIGVYAAYQTYDYMIAGPFSGFRGRFSLFSGVQK